MRLVRPPSGSDFKAASKGAIVPVGQVMQQAGVKFDNAAYVPAVAGYYTAPNGQMLSFPFNSSTTVFYYNKDAFKKAGLDPAFMLALAVTESSLNPSVTGDDGLSIGLFQLNRKFQSYTVTQLLEPQLNADAAMVEMLAVMRRFPGHTYGDYAEAWTLGGTGRFKHLKRNLK